MAPRSGRQGRSWKALERELQRLRTRYSHTDRGLSEFPDLSCDQRPGVAELGNDMDSWRQFVGMRRAICGKCHRPCGWVAKDEVGHIICYNCERGANAS